MQNVSELNSTKQSAVYNFDFYKFGFTHYVSGKNGVDFFRKSFGSFFIELMISGDTYSLSSWRDGEKEMIIANRYKISSQEQLDFLILNGRVGELFA